MIVRRSEVTLRAKNCLTHCNKFGKIRRGNSCGAFNSDVGFRCGASPRGDARLLGGLKLDPFHREGHAEHDLSTRIYLQIST